MKSQIWKKTWKLYFMHRVVSPHLKFVLSVGTSAQYGGASNLFALISLVFISLPLRGAMLGPDQLVTIPAQNGLLQFFTCFNVFFFFISFIVNYTSWIYQWIYFDLLLFRLKGRGGREAKETAFGMFFQRIKVACSVLWLLISLYQQSRLIY
jgi:hypothetical protein